MTEYRDESHRQFAIDGCTCDAWYYHAHRDPDCPLNPAREQDRAARG
jgi:hypothetical protein